MRNTECTIYIATKHGWTQSYRKEKNGWTQTGPNGIVRPLSAEQLLSHILPPLAADNPDQLSVRVEPDAAPAAKAMMMAGASCLALSSLEASARDASI
jgi:hypothetical protein